MPKTGNDTRSEAERNAAVYKSAMKGIPGLLNKLSQDLRRDPDGDWVPGFKQAVEEMEQHRAHG